MLKRLVPAQLTLQRYNEQGRSKGQVGGGCRACAEHSMQGRSTANQTPEEAEAESARNAVSVAEARAKSAREAAADINLRPAARAAANGTGRAFLQTACGQYGRAVRKCETQMLSTRTASADTAALLCSSASASAALRLKPRFQSVLPPRQGTAAPPCQPAPASTRPADIKHSRCKALPAAQSRLIDRTTTRLLWPGASLTLQRPSQAASNICASTARCTTALRPDQHHAPQQADQASPSPFLRACAAQLHTPDAADATTCRLACASDRRQHHLRRPMYKRLDRMFGNVKPYVGYIRRAVDMERSTSVQNVRFLTRTSEAADRPGSTDAATTCRHSR